MHNLTNENIKLPESFISEMSAILGDELNDYINSFNQPASKAIHLNTAKISTSDFEKMYNDSFKKLPYCNNGYQTDNTNIGISPLHHAGLVYSQDPGAMMPVSSLPFEFTSDDIVLDLCAAPGGKSSQLASLLSEKNAMLVSNEIDPKRNQILQSNMERMGYTNVTITKMSPDQVADAFPSLFSFILIDAPCSGEGMFRKYPESIDEWSPENVKMCSDRQKLIIDQIMPALRPGGHILYSTCTYSLAENEEVIKYILDNYNFKVVPLNSNIDEYSSSLHNDVNNPGKHFFPHKAYGEGQYLCLLKSNEDISSFAYCPKHTLKKVNGPTLKLINESLKGNNELLKLNFYEYNKNIIVVPKENQPFTSRGLSVFGIKAGIIEKNRFIPHHHLFKALGHMFSNKLDLTNDQILLNKYLKGEEITVDASQINNGYGVITFMNTPIGGFKASNGRLKNHYPKGLRNMKDFI